MKEKLVKVFTNEWFGAVVGMILTILAMLQEKLLGDMTNAWLLGLSVSVIVGALAEVFRFIICESKYNWKNILPYFGGSLVGMIIMFI